MGETPGVMEEAVVQFRSLTIAVAVALLLVGGCAHKRVLRTGEAAPPPAVDEADRGTDDGADDPAGRPPASEPVPAGEAVAMGIRVADLAQEQIGRPYRWGGENPSYGFDCSGLVQWTYGSIGISMPRVVREQKKRGKSITGDRLRPGDLVFFAISGDRVSHVGVYVGGGRFVHAPRAGQPVRVDSLDDAYWRQRWSDSRRIIDG